MEAGYLIRRSETPDQILIKFEQNSARIRTETLRLKNPARFAKIAGMSEPTTNMEVVPQVSMELHLRGNPPALETIKYSNSASRSDVASGLQQRSLNKAVATTLTLFAAHGSCQRLILFRIHSQETKPSFVRAILSAKHEPQGRSQIRDLADGLFFQLFLKPTGLGHYLDIDLTRLQPDSVKITLDGQRLDDQTALRNLADRIAANSNWDLCDYRLEIHSAEGQHTNHTAFECPSTDFIIGNRFDSAETLLDNPCLAAIREALRHFCANDNHQQLRVGPVRSPAELEDLWAIDSAAYGEASISYEKFQDWWSSFPLGLRALFFRNRVMGGIGIWPLSNRCTRLLKAAQLKESQLIGRTMRSYLDSPARFWYVSGIVLRPQLIGSRAIRVLLSQGMGSWLKAPNIEFPGELLALAYSAQGQALLEGFNFFRIQNAAAMPDHVPLFGLELDTREQFVSLLRAKGLDVE
jgi:hypothetical protein